MKNMYYSKPMGGVLRLSGMILGICLLFQSVLAAVIAPQEFQVQEKALIGTQIGAIEPAGAASYQIIGGNDLGAFALNAETGALTVSDSSFLDFETYQSFSLTVEVKGAGGELSEVAVIIEVQDVAEEPEAITGSAVDITVEGVLINGSFKDFGAETTAANQYGTTELLSDDFDPEVVEGNFVAQPGSGESSFQATLNGLAAGTTYYYRTVAKNSKGIAYGATESFTTLSIPVVESITIRDANPNNSGTVSFQLTFSEPVKGLDESDFSLEITPEDGKTLTADVSSVNDSGDNRVYNITVYDVVGDGTLKLIFKDDDSVVSLADSIPVGGEGAGNGDFEDGEVYTIDQTEPTIIPILYTDEDAAVTYSFSISDLPNDTDKLTVEFYSDNTLLIPDENYELLGSGGNRKIKIYPVAHRHGQAEVKIIVKDGAGNEGDPVNLKIIVRAVADAPLLVANNVEGEEDMYIPLEVGASLVDKDGSETLEQIKISGVPVGATLSLGEGNGEGTYTLSAEQLNGVEFIPAPNGSGEYSLTLEATSRESEPEEDLVTKRTQKATKTFTVTVTAENDAPAFTLVPESKTLLEDFADAEYIVIQPGDVPADEKEQTVSYSVAVKDGKEAIADVIVGQDEDGKPRLEITAIKDANGTQVFTVTANDKQAANNLFTQDFTLTITAENDAPSFELNQYKVVKQEDFGGKEVVNVKNQTNPANERETIEYSLQPAPNEIDFAQLTFDVNTGELTISSKPDRFGSREFELTADDGGLTVTRKFTLRVESVNDAPQFSLDRTQIIVEEDFKTTETVTPTLETPFPYGETNEAVAFSLKPGTVDFANVSIDPVSGVVSITAILDKNGEQEFAIIATDNGLPQAESSVKTFRLKVEGVSDEPILATELQDQTVYEDKAYEYTIPAGVFTDPDGDETLSFSASLASGSALPAWLSFKAGTKTFSGTPENENAGTYEISVVAEDPTGKSVSDSFTLTVMPVNDVPTISEIADVNVQLGDEVPAISFAINDEETAAGELIVTAVAGDALFLPASVISLGGEGENRTLHLSPLIEQFGESEITVTVSDGENEALSSFTFKINFRELGIDVPTLITPNGDGANDTWNIRYLSLYDNCTIRVFDRTGKLVFESTNYLSGPEWDGTLGGNELPEGAYFYEIKLKGGEMSKKGTLTIAR